MTANQLNVTANQKINISKALLGELTENFRRTIFNQHNLLALAKMAVVQDNDPSAEPLVISIDRFNDDLFNLYERLNDLVEAEVQS